MREGVQKRGEKEGPVMRRTRKVQEKKNHTHNQLTQKTGKAENQSVNATI